MVLGRWLIVGELGSEHPQCDGARKRPKDV